MVLDGTLERLVELGVLVERVLVERVMELGVLVERLLVECLLELGLVVERLLGERVPGEREQRRVGLEP